MTLEYIKLALLVLLLIFGCIVLAILPHNEPVPMHGLNLDSARVEAFVSGFKGAK